MNFSQEERRLSEKISLLLSQDFDIFSEKEIMKNPGKFLLDGKVFNSIPDLIIRPKAHLIETNNFIETIIPIEIKKFSLLETNKYEDLMLQCHSYRFSTFNSLQPKLCLYFIDNFFEIENDPRHLQYDYELSKNPGTKDYEIKNYLGDKIKIETLFGRFGIGEIITSGDNYIFRLKRQILFQKRETEILFNSKILNFWRGTSGNPKSV